MRTTRNASAALLWTGLCWLLLTLRPASGAATAKQSTLGALDDADLRGPGSRIIGGAAVPQGLFPFACALVLFDSLGPRVYCSCTLVGDRLALTAAHCAVDREHKPLLEKVFVCANSTDFGKHPGVCSEVVDTAVSDEYSARNYSSTDLALLKLNQTVVQSDGAVRAAALSFEDVADGTQGVILGYGAIQRHSAPGGLLNAGDASLHFAMAAIRTPKSCRALLNQTDKTLTGGLMCADGERLEGPCNGDSGGALFVRESSGHMFAVGVASWAIDCDPHWETVYTKIAGQRDFFDSASARLGAALYTADDLPPCAPGGGADACAQEHGDGSCLSGGGEHGGGVCCQKAVGLLGCLQQLLTSCTDAAAEHMLSELRASSRASCELKDMLYAVEQQHDNGDAGGGGSGQGDNTKQIASPDDACFPASAWARLESGERRSMERLRVGDRVLVSGGVYSEIYAFGHDDPSIEAQFLRVTTESFAVLHISPHHYVHVAGGSLLPASRLRVGSPLLRADSLAVDPVVSMMRVMRRGLYNPHTLNGSIAANGLFVSTYTRSAPPHVAHPLLGVLRLLYRLGVPVHGILRNALPRLQSASWLRRLLPAAPPITSA